MIDTSQVLARLDGVGFLKSLFPDAGEPDAKGWATFRCPFHADEHPSARYQISQNHFKCMACGAGGTAVDLLARATEKPRHVAAAALAKTLGVGPDHVVADEVIARYHDALRQNAELLLELLARKGLDADAVDRWRLGWDAAQRRLVIPLRDELGTVVNLKFYDLLRVHGREKYKALRAREMLLFPNEAFVDPPGGELHLTEGELKAIGLRQRGFNAASGTGGAGGWRDVWNPKFDGLKLYVVYDVDPVGRDRARALAKLLRGRAAEVRLIDLPLDPAQHPHGDVLDYFLAGHSTQDYRNLCDATEIFREEQRAAADDDPTEYQVALGQASRAQYYRRKLALDVVVSAKDTAPYVVPRVLGVTCPRGSLDACLGCPVNSADSSQPEWEVPPDDPAVLEYADASARELDRVLRAQLGIPKSCGVSQIVVKETHNLEEVRLVPQLTLGANETSGEQVVVRGYYVGHGLEVNSPYRARGRACAHPQSQHATLLLTDATPNVDSLSSFAPSDAELQELTLFQPTDWTLAGIDARLDAVYDDLETNVTRIYERRELHALMDLCWHSPLYITLDTEPSKGWLDVLVLGDSGQGKSETALRLLKHYGLGERVDLKGASVAGLKGGLQDTNGRWFVTLGVVPLNDRRMVVLEEVKGAPVEVLQALTDMRSSGVAELAKIERRRAHARTRLLWISNPRSDRRIETYNFGVLAIKELLGSLEDVRRFDAALIVASNEVNAATLVHHARTRSAPHVHTGALCRRLILWAWSRKPDDVTFEPATRERCLDLAVEQGGRYSADVPLVEPADHRYKLARLAAAVAARTFSTDDGQTLVVRPGHVDWAAAFLDRLYGARYMGYAEYSAIQRADTTLVDANDVRALILGTPLPIAVVRGLVRAQEVRPTDLQNWADLERDDAARLLAGLVRNNGLVRRRDVYYKTGALIELLRGLQDELERGGSTVHAEKKTEY